jgi:hypothetical protein
MRQILEIMYALLFIKVDTKKDAPQDNSIPTLADGEIDKQISVEEFKLCLTEDLKENE